MNPGFYVTPEQLVRDRAEFARKGIARGRSILAMEYEKGVLMLAENPGGSLHKISEVYDRIAFAGVGRYNEFETLRKAGIRQADVMGYLYSRDDVTALGLATAFSQTLGVIFSHETKPFEVELLICELGENGQPNQMLQISYDGTLLEGRGVVAIGGKADILGEGLRERFRDGLELDAALRLGMKVFAETERRPLDGWEAAVLERGPARRCFRRLAGPELERASAQALSS
ncbi:MAG: proteasome subunit alpha [bacterium]|nr:proteasome subunit alpha [Acidimicrobiia bacterium]MCY4650331.1 proteasome subunit alpha [bacterium]